MIERFGRRGFLAWAAALTSAATCTSPLAAAPPPGGLRLGFQYHYATWGQGLLDKAVAAGFTPDRFTPRDDVHWHAVEKSKGVLTPEVYDTMFAAFRKRGYKIVATLVIPPSWYPAAAPGALPNTQEGWDAFGRAAAAIVGRFGDDLAGVEILNEPNNANFLYGTPLDEGTLPPIVAGMMRAAYPAIKAIRPDLPVAAGGTVSIASAWYKELARLGALQFCDAVAVHSYAADASLPAVHGDLAALRALTGKPVWLTEAGRSRQAGVDVTTSFWRRIVALGSDAGVDYLSAYQLADDPVFAAIGLLTKDGALAEQGSALLAMAGKLPLVRQPTSTLAPCWRCADGSFLAWTDAGQRVSVGGASPAPLDQPVFLTATPREPWVPVADSVYGYPAPPWQYFGLQGSTKVALTEAGWPYALTLAGPRWLRAGRGTAQPNYDQASVRRWVSDRAGQARLLAQVARGTGGDGVGISVAHKGVPVMHAHVAPGATWRGKAGRTLAVGDAVDWTVSADGSDAYDVTAIRAAVLMPA